MIEIIYEIDYLPLMNVELDTKAAIMMDVIAFELDPM